MGVVDDELEPGKGLPDCMVVEDRVANMTG